MENTLKGSLCDLSPFFIPLKNKGEKNQFARVHVLLELNGEHMHQMVTRRMDEIRSSIFTILTTVPAQKFEWERDLLAEEMKKALTFLLGEGRVRQVLVKEVIIL